MAAALQVVLASRIDPPQAGLDRYQRVTIKALHEASKLYTTDIFHLFWRTPKNNHK